MQTGSDDIFTTGNEPPPPKALDEHGHIGGHGFQSPLGAGPDANTDSQHSSATGTKASNNGTGSGPGRGGNSDGNGNGNGNANTAAVSSLAPHRADTSDDQLDVGEETLLVDDAEPTGSASLSPPPPPAAHAYQRTPPFLGVIPEDDYPDLDLMTPPIPEMDQNPLEVDDEDDGSVYPASQYPMVPARYRVERFDAATVNSSSRSLYDDDLDYQFENGRRYCGDYCFPNDELEQDRLRVLHQVFLNVFDLELTTVPLDDPTYIIDIGTGTGEWAIGMGELYPSCEVVGVDISAIQPTAVPHNVFFEVDYCDIDWMRPDDMADLVHMRNMAGAFSDWDFVYSQALACLKPGGYLEVLDFHDHISGDTSFYDKFPPDSMVHAFARDIDEASIRYGRRRGTHHLQPEALERLGFVDVHVEDRVIGMDPENDTVSKLWLISLLHGVEALSLRLLTKYMNWEPAQVTEIGNQFTEEIRSRALNPATAGQINGYLRVLRARKPRRGEVVPEYEPIEVDQDREDHSEDESTVGP